LICLNTQNLKTKYRTLRTYMQNHSSPSHDIQNPDYSRSAARRAEQRYLLTRIPTQIRAEMSCKEFSPNKLITLLGNRYSTKEQVADAFLHALRVLQRKVYGRYSKTPIKHMSVCESNGRTNPHIHSLILLDTDVLPIEEWMVLLKRIWIKTTHGTGVSLSEDSFIANETWAKDIYDVDSAVDYCFKKSSGDGSDFLFVDRQY